MKTIKFVCENQRPALELSDHRVISRVLQQSVGKLVFERLLPPFKISNMVWFQHDILAI